MFESTRADPRRCIGKLSEFAADECRASAQQWSRAAVSVRRRCRVQLLALDEGHLALLDGERQLAVLERQRPLTK
jgi:hypothetical protein